MELLRLIALDSQDLGVISAHLQDAVVRADDLVYVPRQRRFLLALRRFDWEAPEGEPPRRRLAALHFERVSAVRRLGIDPGREDQVLNLLAITFEETDAPSGTLTLVFSGGAAVRLDVECIEAQLKDLGPAWEAAGRPAHPSTDKDD
ncbi:DUF2948 family protein [Chelatococcus sp. SYSU_G07232]|uniref:DUF2948 family protein n=1 Tax=Chelatococcus albus TaxID=3047466 RepID=A0ABT7AH42_9HYPH|nr:DUF2948 family protein [Chelatococcus sp. SYSU_G07232]MDJ1157961.1 DUF2948 family protein [Chelatococcus sp. SYSU_G07232]